MLDTKATGSDGRVMVRRILRLVFLSLLLSAVPVSVRAQLFLKSAPQAVQRLVRDRPVKPVATALTPSQQGLTVPSLWWTDRQYGQKLVVNWLVYPANAAGQKQVNLVVRSDIWSRFTYSERYAVVNQFGTFANTYGHQLIILNRQGTPLAGYVCDLADVAPRLVRGAVDFRARAIPEYPLTPANEPQCQLWLSPIAAQSGF